MLDYWKKEQIPPTASETVMFCRRCDRLVHPEIIREGGIVFAVWKCEECEAEASQMIGEINPEQARGKTVNPWKPPPVIGSFKSWAPV